MRRIVWLSLLLFTTAVASADNATDPTEAARTSARRFVLGYVEAQNTLATGAAARMWAERAGVSSIGQGELTRGLEAIREGLERRRDAPRAAQLSLGPIEIQFIGEAGAVAVAPFKIANPGGPPIEGALTLVLVREGNGWKLVHEHASAKALLLGQ